MNLDNRSLVMLALQLVAFSSVCSVALLFRLSAATRVWIIRLTIIAASGLACFSQLPATQRLPVQRPIMLPAQIDVMPVANAKIEQLRPKSANRPIDVQDENEVTASQIWGVGLWGGLFWILVIWMRSLFLKRRSTPFGKENRIEVRVTPRASSPLVAGMWRPKIYLPESLASSLKHDDLQSVFAHEIAHVQHRDVFWKVLHRFVCVLLWPNFVLWLLIAQHDRAMEEMADASASLKSGSPAQYANLLLSIAERRKGKDTAFALAMTPKRSNIGRRIRRILNGDSKKDIRLPLLSIRIAVGAVAVAGAGCLIAGFGWQQNRPVDNQHSWLKKFGKVSVRILGPNGKPAIGARAWLRTFQDGNPIAESYAPLTLNDDVIEIDLTDVTASELPMIYAKDSLGQMGTLFFTSGKPSDVLSLLPVTTVSGTIVREDGSPVKGVKVTPASCSFGDSETAAFLISGTPLEVSATTDTEGAFTMRGVPRGCIFQLDVADPAVQRPRNEIHKGNLTFFGFRTGDSASTELGTIQVRPAGSISGTLTLDGKGVSGVHIEAQVLNDDMGKESWGGDTITNANGNYSIGGLGGARYNIAAFLPSDLAAQYACEARESVQSQPGRIVDGQDLQLVTGGIVEGDVVLKDGVSAEGYPVYFYGPEHPQSGAACGATYCDKDGHFKLRLAPGKHYIYLAAEQSRAVSATVSVNAGQTVQITLKE